MVQSLPIIQTSDDWKVIMIISGRGVTSCLPPPLCKDHPATFESHLWACGNLLFNVFVSCFPYESRVSWQVRSGLRDFSWLASSTRWYLAMLWVTRIMYKINGLVLHNRHYAVHHQSSYLAWLHFSRTSLSLEFISLCHHVQYLPLEILAFRDLLSPWHLVLYVRSGQHQSPEPKAPSKKGASRKAVPSREQRLPKWRMVSIKG